MIDAIRKEVVSFKTDTEFYHRESTDEKNNTVRKIDWEDERFPMLQLMNLYNRYGFIQIVDSSNDKFRFKRKIRDACIYKDLMIITWEPENDTD